MGERFTTSVCSWISCLFPPIKSDMNSQGAGAHSVGSGVRHFTKFGETCEEWGRTNHVFLRRSEKRHNLLCVLRRNEWAVVWPMDMFFFFLRDHRFCQRRSHEGLLLKVQLLCLFVCLCVCVCVWESECYVIISSSTNSFSSLPHFAGSWLQSVLPAASPYCPLR